MTTLYEDKLTCLMEERQGKRKDKPYNVKQQNMLCKTNCDKVLVTSKDHLYCTGFNDFSSSTNLTKSTTPDRRTQKKLFIEQALPVKHLWMINFQMYFKLELLGEYLLLQEGFIRCQTPTSSIRLNDEE